MPPHEYDVAEALATAARTMNAPHGLDETLDAIVRAARASVPGFDEVGISVVRANGEIDTTAATGQLVWELDAVQYNLKEGPCLEAIRDEPVVIVEDMRREQRWPAYADQARSAGVRSQMGIQLYVEEETLGGLNLYSTSRESIDAEALHLAELFAAHAALALGRARRESQLAEALGTRRLIGMAIGLVMCRYELTEERAFQYLVRASSTSNIKLRDLAAEVVSSAEERHTPRSE